MKKILLSLTLMLSIPMAVMAAEPATTNKTAEPKVCKKGDWLTKDLGLSAEQQTKVDALFEQNAAKQKALHDELSAGMKEILTPEQNAKLKENHKKYQNYHHAKAASKEETAEEAKK